MSAENEVLQGTGPQPGALGARIKAVLAEHGGLRPAEQASDKPDDKHQEAQASGDGADGAETSQDAPEGNGEAAKPEANAEDKKVGTARAKEWAEIKKVKAQLAKDAREVKRLADEARRDRAEAAKVLQENADLARLRRENPKEFLKRITGDDLRPVLKAALSEPELTDEQRELRALRAELDAIKSARAEETAEQRKQREAAEHAGRARAEQEWHHSNVSKIANYIAQADSLTVHSQSPRLQQQVARLAYEQILDHFQRTGEERNVFDVLASIDSELFPAREQQSPNEKKGSPAQATGAGKAANPEAKRAPVLSSATASARAAASKPASFDDRLKAAAGRLRRK